MNFQLLIILTILSCFSTSLQSQDCDSYLWKEILDFTVLENGNVSLITAANFDEKSNKISGYYHAYDHKGRVIYQNGYSIDVDSYSGADSIRKYGLNNYSLFSAYALDAAKNHTVFYGNLEGQSNRIKILLTDKRGRLKKNLSEEVEWTRDINHDSFSTRSSLYFWMVAHQNPLRLNQYLTKQKGNYTNVQQLVVDEKNTVHSGTGLHLQTSGSKTTAIFLQDGKAAWKQELQGSLAAKKDSESRIFKLIETEDFFYFYLNTDANSACPGIQIPILYCLSKSMHGLPTMQLEITRIRA